MSTSPVHHTSPAHVHARPGPASRRFGYVVGAAVNALLLKRLRLPRGGARAEVEGSPSEALTDVDA